MIINIGGQPRDVRQLTITCGRLQPGDILFLHGSQYQVITVQRDCPRLESLSSVFCMVTLKNAATGEISPQRDLIGRVIVYRPRR